MDRKRGCSILKFYLFAPRFILLHPVHRPAVQILWFCGQGNIKGKLGGDVLVETSHVLGDGELPRRLALVPHHHHGGAGEEIVQALIPQGLFGRLNDIIMVHALPNGQPAPALVIREHIGILFTDGCIFQDSIICGIGQMGCLTPISILIPCPCPCFFSLF